MIATDRIWFEVKMKAFRTYGNEIPPEFWDEYETIPDPIRAKQMDEPFSLDGCEYNAGDYLGVGGITYPKDGPIKYDLFAMPKSMFEDRFRVKRNANENIRR